MLIASAVLSAIWLYGGESLFANFLDLHRPASNAKLFRQVVSLFLRDSLAVVFLPFALVASKRRGKWMPILLYFCFSLLLGAYAVRGAGVDRNAWFSFFIAAALVSGLFASKAHTILSQWRPRALPIAGAMIVLALMMNEFFLGAFVSADGVLQDSSVWFLRITQGALLLSGMLLLNAGQWVPVSSTIGAGAITIVGLLPFLAGVDVAIREAFDYDKLRFEAKAYRADVKLLKTFPGPALFDDLLLGFDGGKELLFDVSNTSKLMFSGRIPEGTLAARIREQHFNVIVTDFDVEERLAADRQKMRAGRAGARTAEWTRWPDSALHALREHYEALDRNGQRGRYVFYVPRGQNTNVAGVG
jgi:hypothetical protein